MSMAERQPFAFSQRRSSALESGSGREGVNRLFLSAQSQTQGGWGVISCNSHFFIASEFIDLMFVCIGFNVNQLSLLTTHHLFLYMIKTPGVMC